MLPNLICPGAQKCATTTLYNLLSQHPDIYFPAEKETAFFSSDHYFNGIEWYLQRYYSGFKGERIVGDISVSYMASVKSVERIYKHLGDDLKFIFLLRNPVDRAYSHFNMSRFRGYEELSFMEALLAENERKKKMQKTLSKFPHEIEFCYLGNGFYAEQINRYLSYWPIENMIFIKFEDFVHDCRKYCHDIFTFLGIKTEVSINSKVNTHKTRKVKYHKINSILYSPSFAKNLVKKMTRSEFREKIKRIIVKYNVKGQSSVEPLDDSVRKELYQKFAADIAETEQITGLDLKEWKIFP